MSTKPLTRKERAWLDELEKVMLQCPSKRLAAYTVGDAGISFFDRVVADAWLKENGDRALNMDAYQLHKEAGSALHYVRSGFVIDSCAG